MKRKEAVGIAAASIVGGAAIVLAATGMAHTLDRTLDEARKEAVNEYIQEHSITLTPCATEDSDNCYWDADTQGNGQGTSFVVIDGVLYFPEMR